TISNGIITTRGLTRFDHSRASRYKGVRWLVALREISYLPFTILALLKARRRWPDIELIHVNEISEIPSAVVAKFLFKVPVVVHTRSLTHTDTRQIRTRWLHRRLRRTANAVIAIDEGVRAALPA